MMMRMEDPANVKNVAFVEPSSMAEWRARDPAHARYVQRERSREASPRVPQRPALRAPAPAAAPPAISSRQRMACEAVAEAEVRRETWNKAGDNPRLTHVPRLLLQAIGQEGEAADSIKALAATVPAAERASIMRAARDQEIKRIVNNARDLYLMELLPVIPYK